MSRCQWCITANGRAGRAAYAKSEKGKAANKKARSNPEHKAKQRAKSRVYALNGKRRLWYGNWAARHRERYLLLHRATQRVQNALRRGDLVRPGTCSACQSPCKPQAHHHNGYDEEHMLDVVWVCISCHEAAHHAGAARALATTPRRRL